MERPGYLVYAVGLFRFDIWCASVLHALYPCRPGAIPAPHERGGVGGGSTSRALILHVNRFRYNRAQLPRPWRNNIANVSSWNIMCNVYRKLSTVLFKRQSIPGSISYLELHPHRRSITEYSVHHGEWSQLPPRSRQHLCYR